MTLLSLLIDNNFTPEATRIINIAKGGDNGETLLYHIDDQSVGAGPEYINYVETVIAKIDAIIDLDFQRTYDWQQADYDILVYDKDPNWEPNTVGFVDYRAESFQVNVFLRESGDTTTSRNTFLHEFMHGLGFGEPGSDPRFDQTDTAMSYNLGDAPDWNNEPTANDIAALIQLWGAENDTLTGGGTSTTGSSSQDDSIGRLYTAAFGRVPDDSGVQYWSNQVNSNAMSYSGVAQAFVSSDEFTSRFGNNISNEQFISNLYQNVLNRAPDSDGLNYWMIEMNQNGMSRPGALIGFADSAENRALYDSLVN